MAEVVYKDYSMDARMAKVISENLENGSYLEIYLHDGELVHVNIKENWTSMFTFGVVGWGEPYLYVVGERNESNEALLEEIREMLSGKKSGYVVEDHLCEEWVSHIIVE